MRYTRINVNTKAVTVFSMEEMSLTGLSLTFNVNQDDYIGDLAEGAGVRVVVHDQAQMPFPEYYGIAVNPGQLTYIGASMVIAPSYQSVEYNVNLIFSSSHINCNDN